MGSITSEGDIFNFNPRTRVGCDNEGYGGAIAPRSISIHAPGWGATRLRLRTGSLPGEFQSTHPGGVRLITLFSINQSIPLFQSTHPGGVRPMRIQISHITSKFQSTHPGGVRLGFYLLAEERDLISIHAPGWGATVCGYAQGASQGNFNPRTRVGCDYLMCNCFFNASYFNPRTRVGCDRLYCL